MSGIKLDTKQLEADLAAFIRDEERPLPIPVQSVDEHGDPVGPPITTWRELHASGAFADPVRDALAEAHAAVKKAEDLVRARYLADTNGDAAALRPVLGELTQAGFHAGRAVAAWKPHEYPRKIEEEKTEP